MTNNETERCPDCGRPYVTNEGNENIAAYCATKWFGRSEKTVADCASHANAKAVPGGRINAAIIAGLEYVLAEVCAPNGITHPLTVEAHLREVIQHLGLGADGKCKYPNCDCPQDGQLKRCETFSGCTRSHPHEEMSAECEALTVTARANNYRARAESSKAVPEEPDSAGLYHDSIHRNPDRPGRAVRTNRTAKAVPAEGRRAEEPVAWLVESVKHHSFLFMSEGAAKASFPDSIPVPLYTRPAIADGFVAVPMKLLRRLAEYAADYEPNNPPEAALFGQDLKAAESILFADSGREGV